MRGIWDWGVCTVVCNVRAAFGKAGCGPKCEFSRTCEEMQRLADHGNEGNPVFGRYERHEFLFLLTLYVVYGTVLE